MALLDPQKTLEELAMDHPKLVPALEKMGVHYAHAARLTLEDICAVHCFNLDDLLQQLDLQAREAFYIDDATLAQYDIPELIGYILFTHHAFLEKELPRLEKLLSQAIQDDGPGNPVLLEILAPFRQFMEAIQWHMREEEKHLFPFLLLLVAPNQSPALSQESVENLTHLFEFEDDEIRLDLEQLRNKTRGFHVPSGASDAFQEFYGDLSRLDAELNRHMRVENGILFPKVIAAEARLRESQVQAETARQGLR